mgnify:CR=1 FL=1
MSFILTAVNKFLDALKYIFSPLKSSKGNNSTCGENSGILLFNAFDIVVGNIIKIFGRIFISILFFYFCYKLTK